MYSEWWAISECETAQRCGKNKLGYVSTIQRMKKNNMKSQYKQHKSSIVSDFRSINDPTECYILTLTRNVQTVSMSMAKCPLLSIPCNRLHIPHKRIRWNNNCESTHPFPFEAFKDSTISFQINIKPMLRSFFALNIHNMYLQRLYDAFEAFSVWARYTQSMTIQRWDEWKFHIIFLPVHQMLNAKCRCTYAFMFSIQQLSFAMTNKLFI